jgi:hypothetical protein
MICFVSLWAAMSTAAGPRRWRNLRSRPRSEVAGHLGGARQRDEDAPPVPRARPAAGGRPDALEHLRLRRVDDDDLAAHLRADDQERQRARDSARRL